MRAVYHTDTKRIDALDVIRGISLLGILIINIQTYTLFAFLRPGQVYTLQLDRPDTYVPLQFFISLIIKGQFYTLHGFLFGIGFYLAWQKNRRQGLDAGRLARRRLGALLLFGCLHAFAFWFGDALHQYALLGFTLFYFNKKSIPVLVKWIIALSLFVILFLIIKTVYFPASEEAIAAGRRATEAIVMQAVDTWQYGSMASVTSWQKWGVVALWKTSARNGFAALVQYQVMFLVGLTAGKMNFFHRLPELKPQLKRIAWSVLPVALLLKAVSAPDVLNVPPSFTGSPADASLLCLLSGFVAVPLLTGVYLIFFFLLFQKKPTRFWRWIANTGCAALTNYLVQTAMCSLLFYGYAFGLAGHVTLAGSFIQVLLIYALQVLFSNLWMKDHTTGPVEMLWRRMTYGRGKTAREAPVKVSVLSVSKGANQMNEIQ